MNKIKSKILFLMIFFCSVSEMLGQTTYYYKLTKKIQNGIEYTNTGGGQFVSFIGNKCYDSDRYGISVGNGQLVYNEQYSSNSKTYIGDSYFGNAMYRFKTDMSVLNIIVNKSLIYVYKRQTVPSSVTTCSLIRKRGSSSGNNGSYLPSYPNNGYGGGYNTNNGGSSSSSQRQNTVPSRTQPTKHTCSLCNGQRRIIKDTYPSLYGQSDYQVKCNECGGYFMRSTGHTHITCPQCHGKGYFTTN